jgi:hypothetical protein
MVLHLLPLFQLSFTIPGIVLPHVTAYNVAKGGIQMKKTLVLLVLFAFIPCISFAASDDYAVIHEAFSEHSIDDLLTLQRMVEIELEHRGYQANTASDSKAVTVPVGKYKIGVDIPANAYTIKHNGNAMSMVTIYTESGRLLTVYTISPNAPIGKCELQEGQSIDIVGEPVIFAEYEGLGF